MQFIIVYLFGVMFYLLYYYFTKEIEPNFAHPLSSERRLARQLSNNASASFQTDEYRLLELMRAYHDKSQKLSGRLISPLSVDYFQIMTSLPGVHTVYFKIALQVLYSSVLPPRFFITRSNNCTMLMIGLQSFDAGRIECTVSRDYSFRSLRAITGSKGRLRINFKLGLFKPWLSKDGTVLSRQGLRYTSNAWKMDSNYDDADDADAHDDIMLRRDVTAWHVHVISGGVVTDKGEVYTADHKVQIASLGWVTTDHPFRQPPKRSARVYDEVFILSQYFRGAIFHWMIEEFPRLFRMLPFLVKHPNIWIHVSRKTQLICAMLAGVGINANRILSGNVNARMVYLPTSTYQGRGSVINTNFMASHLRAQLGTSAQDSIVLIKRSHSKRWFNHHDAILKMLKRVANEFGLRVMVFSDSPVPKLDVTKHLFHDAVAVVGPHGAGFANLIYSRPGTCVVEALCYRSRDKRYELCFRHLAHILGHLYHGITKDFQCCMDTKPEDIEPFARQCLEYRKQQRWY